MRYFAKPILAIALLSAASAMAAEDPPYQLRVPMAVKIGGGTGPGPVEPELGDYPKLELTAGPTVDGKFGYNFKDLPRLATESVTWTVQNNGTARSGLLAVSSPPVTGQIVTTSGDCNNHPGLEPGQSCNLTVQFTAATPDVTAEFAVSVYETTNSDSHIELVQTFSTHKPLASLFDLTSFGEVAIGDSATAKVVITNPTSRTTDIGLSKFATGSSQYTLSHGCGPTLAPYATCELTVTFTPVEQAESSGNTRYTYGPGLHGMVPLGQLSGRGI